MKSKSLQLALLILLAACAQLPEASPPLGTTASSDYTIQTLFKIPDQYGHESLAAMSADGGVIVGNMGKPFRWTQAGGIKYFGTDFQTVTNVSDDGTTIVGANLASYQAFRWQAATGIQNLGLLPQAEPSFEMWAGDVSANGSVVSGCYQAEGSGINPRVFRWTAAGGIADIASGYPYGLSSAGDVIPTASNGNYRWTQAGGSQPFPQPAGDEFYFGSPSTTCGFSFPSGAGALSDDGNVMVGGSGYQNGPMRWTLSGGFSYMTPPKMFDGFDLRESRFDTVSGNGLVAVGVGFGDRTTPYRTRLLRWSQETGVVDITAGVSRMDSVETDISYDGSVIIGSGGFDRPEYQNGVSNTSAGFVWTPSGGMQELSGVGTNYYAEPLFVSDNGNIIVGKVYNDAGVYAVKWTRGGSTSKQNQTITFTSTSPSSATVGSAYTVRATASSGLAVSFSSATSSVCTVLASTVKFVAAGTCTISANQAGNASYNAAPTVSQTLGVLANYSLNFNTLVAGKIVASVSKGLGIATTGPVTDAVPVSGVRNANIGNVAMVQGTRKLLILSKDGKSQIPYAYGGTMTFDFSAFGTGSVTVKSIKVNGMSKTGGSVKVYSGTTLLKSVAIPRLSSTTTRILTIGALNADRVVVTLTGSGKIDDLIVSQ